MVEAILGAALFLLLAVFAPPFLKKGLRPMLTVAVLSGLASVGGAALVAIPGVQPSSFIVFVCGMAFGPGAGLLCGALTAVLSRLLTGLGPWVFWQALLWGVMGLTAGFLRKAPPWVLGLAGFMWGFVFGWAMNLMVYSLGAPFTWSGYMLACAASFVPDLGHAVTNAVLLFFFGRKCMRIFYSTGGKL